MDGQAFTAHFEEWIQGLHRCTEYWLLGGIESVRRIIERSIVTVCIKPIYLLDIVSVPKLSCDGCLNHPLLTCFKSSKVP